MNPRPELPVGLAVWRSLALTATAVVLQTLGSATPVHAYCGYVADSESNFVSVIDTAANTVSATIAQCDSGLCQPNRLAITPDDRFLYVANRGSDAQPGDTVSVVETATNTVVSTITTVGNRSVGIAVTPDGRFVYVVQQASVSVIDTDKALTDPSNAVIKIIQESTVSRSATSTSSGAAVVIAPDGRRAYVPTSDGSLAVIDTSSNTVLTTVPGVGSLVGLAIAANGSLIYGTDFFNDRVVVVDTTKVLTDPSHALTKTIQVGGTPYAPAITPDGRFVYVPNCGGFCFTGEPSSASSISVIDTTVNEVATTLPLPAASGAAAVAFTPEGAFAYVTYAEADAVAVVDTTKAFADPAHAVVKEIEGAGPRSVAIAIASLPMCINSHPTCVGDCGVDRQVTVNEIIAMVNIALGNADVSGCQAGDLGGDGQITVDEIITGINNALGGC